MANNAGKIVIIGAGHAGDAAAAHLRQYGHTGPISLLSAEKDPPYHRPPLSKAWLKGSATVAAFALRAPDFYERQNISLRLGIYAEGIDRTRRLVHLRNGEMLPYAHLILATGARARVLAIPGADRAHVHLLRTRLDADALRQALVPGSHLAIIGGGYIGLEVAASANALGATVTVLEREPRLLARVASAPLATFFHRLHSSHGVNCRLAAEARTITPRAVILTDGTEIPAGAVVIGVGAVPNVELARDAGLNCENGILVDASACTSDAAIYAIGDCTARPVMHHARKLRLESVPNALEQARQAAAAITGRPAPAPEVPWFWSDQYGARLQIAGLLQDAQETVIRPFPDDEIFAAFHLGADGTLLAVEAVNAAEEFMAGRTMIARRRIPQPTMLADPTIPMKSIAA